MEHYLSSSFSSSDLFIEHFPNDHQKCLTFGDSTIDPKSGKETPNETVLTSEIEFNSRQCLDYIFEIKDK